MYTISNRTMKPFEVHLELNEVSTTMEVDIGPSVSIMSEDRFKGLQENGATLHASGTKLFTYMGELIKVLGTTDVTMKHNGHVATLPLLVTSGTGPSQPRLASSLEVRLEGDLRGALPQITAKHIGCPQGGIR